MEIPEQRELGDQGSFLAIDERDQLAILLDLS